MSRTTPFAIKSAIATAVVAGSLLATPMPADAGPPPPSVARQWNDVLLESIRHDNARPTVHARNLFHTSVAMWDAWAAYDDVADQWLINEKQSSTDIQADREEAISFAVYRVMKARFAKSPGSATSLPLMDGLMDTLGYDKDYVSTIGNNPAALGNRIAVQILAFGLNDGANEAGNYANLVYQPINEPLLPDLPGNPQDLDFPPDGIANYVLDPNRWQPLALEFFIGQSGVILDEYPEFLSPEWGIVTPFSMTYDDLTIYPDPNGSDFEYWVYHDPGPPPYLGGVGDDYYKWGYEQVAIWSGHLDATDGVEIDISPASIGNAPLPEAGDYEAYYNLLDGGDWGTGWPLNPVTGVPYTPQVIPRGDYGRILAEFWADGPDSETPPGHWFTLANYVADHASTVKQLEGEGPVLDDLEWDVKNYLALGGCMHDVAIASWGVKGYYDYIRPVSAIRYMCDLGQCSDPKGPSYNPDGIHLYTDRIEVVTATTTMPGGKHENLAGEEGKIALKAWKGPDYIVDPDNDVAGVDWILAENWWPYQRPSFVTPPFAGYVSGHSTYSRAAAWIMTLLTGSPYFPDGLGEFEAPMNEFLVFEDGPSMNVTLQWASYFDASDQCSLSRIWGGIHPGADDIPGRQMGEVIGPEAFDHAKLYFGGRISCPSDLNGDRDINVLDLLGVILGWGGSDQDSDANLDGVVDVQDLLAIILGWGPC